MSDTRPFPFVKMSGSGNDFILTDNRDGHLAGLDLAAVARAVCARHTGVGADGFIALEKSCEADFRWRFFNADGSAAAMCGNGGRCAARFAFVTGMAPAAMRFETGAGIISAEVKGDVSRLQMTRPHSYEADLLLPTSQGEVRVDFVDTGVPHAVAFVPDPGVVDVDGLGREIRFHQRFAPAGANVNFVATVGAGLQVRTYERGVESETMACGTGAVASALCAWKRGLTGATTVVETAGGEPLTIHIQPEAGEEYPTVFLEGRTVMVCHGTIDSEAIALGRV